MRPAYQLGVVYLALPVDILRLNGGPSHLYREARKDAFPQILGCIPRRTGIGKCLVNQNCPVLLVGFHPHERHLALVHRIDVDALCRPR